MRKLIDEEIKPVIKKKFDYDIPIAKVEDAGITTTGAASEGNQIPVLVKEYQDYSITKKLWSILNFQYVYRLDENGSYCSFTGDKEIIKL